MSAANTLTREKIDHVFATVISDSFDDAFDDAVNAAQKTFRAVLDAMSRPGSIVPLPHVPSLPSNINTDSAEASKRMGGLLALARTLCDADTTVWFDQSLRSEALMQYMRFHCACPVAEMEDTQESVFAFIGNALDMPRLSSFNQGSLAYPDRSTTLIITCPLGNNNSALNAPSALRATGPGIAPWQSPLALPLTAQSKEALPLWFWDDVAQNAASYPMGVDIIFVDATENGVQIMALPRSVSVSKA